MHATCVEAFFQSSTSTFSYVVWDAATHRAAVVDSALDYDPAAGRVETDAVDALIAFVRGHDLAVDWIVETHVHADHLSAAQHVKSALGGRTAIGAEVGKVQQTFGELFNLGAEFARDGSQFDHLFRAGESWQVGELAATAIATPGHTPACMSYLIGDALFVGDTLFMADYGTARCDFPGGDAATLYRSIQRLFALPDATRMFLCHDYLPPGRANLCHETTVAAQRHGNVHVHAGVSEDEFVALREARDAGLRPPRLLLPAVQVNIRAGRLPAAEANGTAYLKIPLNRL